MSMSLLLLLPSRRIKCESESAMSLLNTSRWKMESVLFVTPKRQISVYPKKAAEEATAN